MPFTISRSIEIDAGHRVPTHGSKCANLHGHRYKVIAECSSLSLIKGGQQEGMVLDFGFLKEVLIDKVDRLCDHGMILYCDDPWADKLLVNTNEIQPFNLDTIKEHLTHGWAYYLQEGDRGNPSKLLIVPFIPTAEHLAEFWYKQMKSPILELSKGIAHLQKVTVWETPNCCATFPI